MIYSKIYLQKKTNGMLVVIAILAAVASLYVALTVHRGPVAVRESETPLERLEVVNTSSNQVSLFWETTLSEQSWIQFGSDKSSLTSRLYDDRDLAADPHAYTYHLTTLDNLQEDTVYYYEVVSARGAYRVGSDHVFQFRTPKKSYQIVNVKPAYGKILLPNGKAQENILVYLKVGDAYPTVVFTKQTGEWLIPLNGLVSKSSNKSIVAVAENTEARLDFYSEQGQISHLLTNVSNITPLSQTMLLGSDYSLLAKGNVLSAATNVNSRPTFTVVYPRENALIPVGKPLIKGTGIPGSDVFVFINSRPQYAYRATVDSRGEWRVLPTQNIGAGSYIAAVTSRDDKGSKITINRQFMIAKSGEQVLGEATNSPTTVPTPTTSLPQPTSGVSVTPGPVTPSPTIIAYLSPTPQPTLYVVSPTQAVLVSPTVSQPPRSGVSFDYLLIIGIAFLVMGGGIMLVF